MINSIILQAMEKSGNFILSQGNLERNERVMEIQGISKFSKIVASFINCK